MLHVDVPSLEEFKTLALARDKASVSIYVPTSPSPADASANRIAFEDLAKEALAQVGELVITKRRRLALEARLAPLAGRILPSPHAKKLRLGKLDPGMHSDAAWRVAARGVAVLATPGSMVRYRLSYGPKALAEVSDRFHLTPLIRVMTSPLDVFVLALSATSVRLVHAFVNLPPQRVQVPGLPKDLEEATRRPDNATSPYPSSGKEDKKVLLQKFARTIAGALRPVLAGQGAPLVLAATEPMAALFRTTSRYPRMVDEIIPGDHDETTDAELADAALPILDRLYRKDIEAVHARYAELYPRLATADLSYAAHAATAGAVEELLVDLDAVVPGFVSEFDGSVTYAASDTPQAYSIVDEVARRALLTGARVLGTRSTDIPILSPVVAILRYPFGVAREPETAPGRGVV